MCPRILPIKNFVQAISFFLIVDWLRCDIEHLFQGETFMILDNTLNSWEILSHECRCIQCRSHEHSPYYWMFITWLCNARHSFLSVSHLVFDFVHKFCCVTAHDEIFKISLFLAILWLRFPRSIVNAHSCREEVPLDEGQLFARNPKRYPQVSPIDRALQLHFSPLEKTKIDHNPLLYNLVLTIPQVSPFYRHLEQIFQDLDIHTRSFPGLMRLKKTRTKTFLRSNSSWVDLAVTRPSPDSCWARFAIAAVQAVELKWLILNKLNKWFHSSREIPFGLVPKTETIGSHNSRASKPSNLSPVSKEIISDSVELWETAVCFLHIQLIGTNVWLPKTHNVPPEVDFESSRSPAKSESWNSPNLHCLAVFPTWQHCLYSLVWWIFEINRFKRLSQSLVHFVMDRASLFTDHKKNGSSNSCQI